VNSTPMRANNHSIGADFGVATQRTVAFFDRYVRALTP
jgi:hypothetical protein